VTAWTTATPTTPSQSTTPRGLKKIRKKGKQPPEERVRVKKGEFDEEKTHPFIPQFPLFHFLLPGVEHGGVRGEVGLDQVGIGQLSQESDDFSLAGSFIRKEGQTFFPDRFRRAITIESGHKAVGGGTEPEEGVTEWVPDDEPDIAPVTMSFHFGIRLQLGFGVRHPVPGIAEHPATHCGVPPQ
jgi:hypothetical protein